MDHIDVELVILLADAHRVIDIEQFDETRPMDFCLFIRYFVSLFIYFVLI